MIRSRYPKDLVEISEAFVASPDVVHDLTAIEREQGRMKTSPIRCACLSSTHLERSSGSFFPERIDSSILKDGGGEGEEGREMINLRDSVDFYAPNDRVVCTGPSPSPSNF